MCLAANQDILLVAANLAPNDWERRGMMGKTAEVDLKWVSALLRLLRDIRASLYQPALRADFSKGRAVGLSNGNEFTTLGTRPTPGGGPLAGGASQVSMVFEVVEVDLVAVSAFTSPKQGKFTTGSSTYIAASECVVGIARDDLGDPINTRNGGATSIRRIYARVHEASGCFRIPHGLKDCLSAVYMDLIGGKSDNYMLLGHGSIHDGAAVVVLLTWGVADLADGRRER